MPLWAIGLALAVIAPFIVRVLGDVFDARARKRTISAIAAKRSQEPP